MDRLTQVYERLEELDAATAETRASKILSGLGFTPEKQNKKTKEFSGGWRMRIALARALFIQPTLLLLDEPTNHLDMEAVVWLEDYLTKWDKILLMVSHSQDFMNSVCSHIVHLSKKRLIYYSGNYDSFIQTRLIFILLSPLFLNNVYTLSSLVLILQSTYYIILLFLPPPFLFFLLFLLFFHFSGQNSRKNK